MRLGEVKNIPKAKLCWNPNLLLPPSVVLSTNTQLSQLPCQTPQPFLRGPQPQWADGAALAGQRLP